MFSLHAYSKFVHVSLTYVCTSAYNRHEHVHTYVSHHAIQRVCDVINHHHSDVYSHLGSSVHTGEASACWQGYWSNKYFNSVCPVLQWDAHQDTHCGTIEAICGYQLNISFNIQILFAQELHYHCYCTKVTIIDTCYVGGSQAYEVSEDVCF